MDINVDLHGSQKRIDRPTTPRRCTIKLYTYFKASILSLPFWVEFDRSTKQEMPVRRRYFMKFLQSLTDRTSRSNALQMSRQSPVIIITGTPGTGKSTHAHLLSEESSVPLQHINVGEWVKERDLHEGYDQEWQSYTVDEDRVGVLHPVKVLRIDFDYRMGSCLTS
jgi:hypothetical protein